MYLLWIVNPKVESLSLSIDVLDAGSGSGNMEIVMCIVCVACCIYRMQIGMKCFHEMECVGIPYSVKLGIRGMEGNVALGCESANISNDIFKFVSSKT